MRKQLSPLGGKEVGEKMQLRKKHFTSSGSSSTLDSVTMDLEEEERDMDDEMAEDNDDSFHGDDIKSEFNGSLASFNGGGGGGDPTAFLNEDFVDSEDLDDEMDGECLLFEKFISEFTPDFGEKNQNKIFQHYYFNKNKILFVSDDDKAHNSSSKHDCSLCESDTFLSRKSLRHHVRRFHISSCLWTCQNCGGVSPDAETFKTHLVKVHKVLREAFAADEPSENPLLRPCLTIPEDVHKCPEGECDQSFANKTSLKLHR